MPQETPPSPIAIGWIPNISGKLIFQRYNKDGFNISVADTKICYSAGNYKRNKKEGGKKTLNNRRQEGLVYTTVMDTNDLSPNTTTNRYTRLVFFGSKDSNDTFNGEIYAISMQSKGSNQIDGFNSDCHLQLLNEIDNIASSRDSHTPPTARPKVTPSQSKKPC